ncbi:hypothetical protein [Paenibacillus medicaginis]|uniref:Uncharacterized protein n=1 Tax=Paenibacillus medicaginis TaxID=1470560 RepID=A0ABV5C4A7_9BACL
MSLTFEQMKDIEFLAQLQKELNSQDIDSQAAPRFWSVGDYKWVECSEDNAERFSVYLPNDGESYEINYFLKEILDKEDLSQEDLEEFDEIGCEESAFEWIKDHYDEGATLHPEREERFVRENTMFLTKAEAKQHIKANHYHYTPKAHTYAMTAWRAPKVERLLKILSEFDFEGICSEVRTGEA